MKAKINKRFFTAAVCLMVCVTASAQAQSDSLNRYYSSPCTSIWTNYRNPTETYSIVRSNVMNRVVYIREKEKVAGMVSHTFIVNYNNTSEVAFSTTFFPGFFYSVEITDMRLYEDTCYFCGKQLSYFRDYIIEGRTRERGFVGRFVTKEIVEGSGSVEYYIVDSATHLTRLAISKANGAPLLISAIGQRYPSLKECIVEMENHGTWWDMQYDTLHTADHILFSDIMTMRDSITLLAQYICTNDYPPDSIGYDYSHQMFLLDRFNLKGCYATHNSGYHHMALHYMPIFENYYFHHDKAPMRLFHINDIEKEFGVAFVVKEETGFHSGIRLFKFRHAWQYYSSLYYRAGTDTEIKEIGNMYKSDTLYVLSKDNAHPNGLITLPEMGIAPNPVAFLYHYAYTFNSLTQVFAGNHINISGHGSLSSFQLYDQHVFNNTAPSCFQTTFRQYEPLSGGPAERQYVKWAFTDKKKFEWKTANITQIPIETDTICERCNQ